MMLPDLNGKWTGELIYGEGFGHLEHEVLLFAVEITQQGDEFSGIYVDIDGIGINPYKAELMGFCDTDQVNFVKEYKSGIPASIGIEESPGTEVSFSGCYNPVTREIEGEWVGVSIYTALNPWLFAENKGGTWRMRRQS